MGPSQIAIPPLKVWFVNVFCDWDLDSRLGAPQIVILMKSAEIRESDSAIMLLQCDHCW